MEDTGHQMQLNMGHAVWAPLTNGVIDDLHSKTGRTLICRIRHYNSTIGKLRFPTAMDMPMFNSHFVLVGNRAAPLNTIRIKYGGQAAVTRVDTQGVFRK